MPKLQLRYLLSRTTDATITLTQTFTGKSVIKKKQQKNNILMKEEKQCSAHESVREKHAKLYQFLIYPSYCI